MSSSRRPPIPSQRSTENAKSLVNSEPTGYNLELSDFKLVFT